MALREKVRTHALRLGVWTLIVVGGILVVRGLRLVERLTVWREIDAVWSRQPPVSTASFWTFKDAIVTRTLDERVAHAIDRVLGARFDARRVREYHALPLVDYLRLRGAEIGTGAFLTITNIRGERVYLTRAAIEREQPLIVIGLDDERELFRLYQRHRTKREKSWEEPGGSMPWTIRPLGAFVYFPTGRDPHHAVSPEGFALSEEDPLAAIRGVPAPVAEVLTGSADGCLECHSLAGAGARSHHTHAITGQPHGGDALPLESYDRPVMQRFLFDQKRVAEMIGVSPLMVDEPRKVLDPRLADPRRQRVRANAGQVELFVGEWHEDYGNRDEGEGGRGKGEGEAIRTRPQWLPANGMRSKPSTEEMNSSQAIFTAGILQ